MQSLRVVICIQRNIPVDKTVLKSDFRSPAKFRFGGFGVAMVAVAQW